MSVSVARGLVVVRSAELEDGVISLAAGDHVELGAARNENAMRNEVAGTASGRPSSARAPMPAVAVSDLLRDADEARRAGNMERALSLLAQAGDHNGPESGLALLSRGRLLIEAGRSSEAVIDIRRAMRRGLPAALRGAALQSLERAEESQQ